MSRTWIVVPCYNEASRLRGDDFSRFVSQNPEVHILFVDDGSTDATPARLSEIAASNPQAFDVVTEPSNRGKAEAVRHGMNEAFRAGADYAGYWDADLATPLTEIPRFMAALDAEPSLEALFGSRVQLLGRTIERNAARHYLGRVSATAISLTLGLAVYDTQCGAKLFRASPECKALFAEPFLTRWVFDVEILARMLEAQRTSGGSGPAETVREVPLAEWRDVAGSKVTPLDFFRCLQELVRIYRRHLRH